MRDLGLITPALLPRVSTLIDQQVSFAHTSNRPVVATTPIPVFGASRIRLYTDVDGMTNLDGFTPSIRLMAVRTDRPGSVTQGTAITADTSSGNVQTFGTSFPGSNYFVQGVLLGEATDTTGGTAHVKFQAQLDGVGVMLASTTVTAEPDANASYILLGGVFPVVNLTGVMGAVQIRTVSGTLAWGLHIRYFKDPTRPEGTWVDLYTASSVTAASEVNTGLVTSNMPGTSDMYGQLAASYSGSSATAVMQILIAGRIGAVAS